MSIKQKLYLIAAIALAGFIAVFIANSSAKKAIIKYENIQIDALEAESDMLQARRSEKDFLVRKDAKYIGRNKANVELAISQLKSIIALDGEFAERAGVTIEDMRSYLALFQDVAAQVEKQGFSEKEGLRGKLRDTIHKAEEMIKAAEDDTLLAAMLMLRRREKDFIIRKDFKYLDKFNADMIKMQAKASASEAFSPEQADQMQALLRNYSTSFTEYAESERNIVELTKEFTVAAHKLEADLNELLEWSQQTLEERIDRENIISLIIELLAILGVAVAVILTARSILGPLGKLQEGSRNVADGDFDACQSFTLTGELESLRNDIVSMVDSLKKAMDDAEAKGVEAEHQAEKANEAMNEAREREAHTARLVAQMTTVAETASGIANSLASAATELSGKAGDIVQGAELQREQVTSTATAMEEMNATVLEVAHNSSNAAENAHHSREQAIAGQDKVSETVEAVVGVQTTTNELTEVMDDLLIKADSIGTVMNVITDIADQTNLLALNAAIEAARAGEAGRGFAVVADEVRKLAEKTMTATQEVGQAINGIQTAVDSSVSKSKHADTALEEATTHAHEAGQLLGDIVSTVQNSADMVRSIATAAEQQSATSEEINRNIDEIHRISEETTHGMTESAQAIEEIAALAEELNAIIEELNDAAAS
ncbi:methyl-accepting chemotaxis protein [Pseudodesulfovibrio sp. zrk46]|uniref:methyl-accepting chemotaxis protein n=1 Tax=Pseudodesulfovibrio sp. zrk46 TaxID=2725288 RepID=UPI001449D5ED|nr:methyl-accepting chemotaxis protein [Pseudodesulfovibrio sp. zrk46]QJB55054.1 HAMP domain-containing protein [Pseudodesulfovibrio sp. zrk46]